jgi:nitroreductase
MSGYSSLALIPQMTQRKLHMDTCNFNVDNFTSDVLITFTFRFPCRCGVTMMTRRQANVGMLAGAALAAVPSLSAAPAQKSIELPSPRMTGGKPLMDVLKMRHSTREYSNRSLAPETLSDLLWAAFGINRPSGDRTAPYWRHIMVIDIYAAMADGVWLYEPKAHTLAPHLPNDIRAQTGTQDFVATAPLNLIYVAHGERMTDVSKEDRRLYASVDAGFIGQNVYLYCASEGLATVFRGAVDYPKLTQAMQLPEEQFVIFAQTVGYART